MRCRNSTSAMKKKRKSVNLGKTGCLCWELQTYSPECCDPDDRYAEEIGVGVGNEPEEEIEES